MYGYVVPKKENLEMRDFVLYRAFYCGICKGTGRVYGQLPRFTTNYDMVFLSLLLHDCAAQDVEFENGGCVLNPFKKKTTVCRNGLFDRLLATNILLCYYKIGDDIADSDGRGKKLAKRLFKKAYNRAAKSEPKIDGIIRERYNELSDLERQNSDCIDRVAHCFASLLKEVASELLAQNADDNVLGLCYNIGKFVYLIDAVDDIDEDFKKNRYNPFLALHGGYENRRQFLSDNHQSISFLLSVTVNRAIECFNNMRFSQSYDLMKNIVHTGLREKCNEILSSTKKLPRPKI